MSSASPKKGSFGRTAGRAELPLSNRYLVPGPRRTMLLGGLAVGLVAVLLVWLDVQWDGGDALSGGPLSSAHATLDMSCSSCHGGAFQAVADVACTECHEGAMQDGVQEAVFSFQAHAVLRTTDATPRTFDVEPGCADCHGEHAGRAASLVAIPDGQCLACHENHRFDRDHPDFAFTGQPRSDDDALRFAHGRHVKEVLKRTGWDEPERTCLTCHQPTDDVRGFAPIRYDLHCAACHLGAGVATTRLPVETDSAPGVWTLDRIRASGLPDTDWSFYTDPNDFRVAGRGERRRVIKTQLDHEDPWVLFNLRRLRHLRYGDAGVADLLVTAPDPWSDQRRLYEQAVTSLEAQAEELRGASDPAVQSDLEWVEEELASVRRALDEPSPQLAGVDLPGSSKLAPSQVASWDELVTDLSAQCASCHRMDRATIVGIESDQRVLTRAEFDHAPHLMERSCLDCHGRLPILEALDTEALETEALDPVDLTKNLDSLDDQAEIHNLPGIATCRECHGPKQVASACVDCHTFHPDATSRRASQLVQLGAADLRESTGPNVEADGGAP